MAAFTVLTLELVQRRVCGLRGIRAWRYLTERTLGDEPQLTHSYLAGTWSVAS